MNKYKDSEYIKSIKNFNEVINYCTHFHNICNYNSSNLEVIKYCVENGADLNIMDDDKWTSFFWICCKNTTKEVLEYCLNNGADLSIKDRSERTPFYYICTYNNNLSHYMGSGYNRIIKYCKQYMDEYDFIKTLKECNINWKEYV